MFPYTYLYPYVPLKILGPIIVFSLILPSEYGYDAGVSAEPLNVPNNYFAYLAYLAAY